MHVTRARAWTAGAAATSERSKVRTQSTEHLTYPLPSISRLQRTLNPAHELEQWGCNCYPRIQILKIRPWLKYHESHSENNFQALRGFHVLLGWAKKSTQRSDPSLIFSRFQHDSDIEHNPESVIICSAGHTTSAVQARPSSLCCLAALRSSTASNAVAAS